MIIDSQKSWWNAVDERWSDLLEIISHHMDMGSPAYEKPGDASSAMTGRCIAVELELLKINRDHDRIARYFNAAWGLASEAYAWSVPSWGVLCDLCSEEWVFHEDALAGEEKK